MPPDADSEHRRPHADVITWWRFVLLVSALSAVARAQPPHSVPPVTLVADFGSVNNAYGGSGSQQVVVLRRRVTIRQGTTTITAGQAVVWIDSAAAPAIGLRLTVYAEDNVRLDDRNQTHHRHALLHTLDTSTTPPRIRIGQRSRFTTPPEQDPLVRRAIARRHRQPSSRASLVTYQADDATPVTQGVQEPQQQLRRVQLFPRTNRPFNVSTHQSTATTPGESVVVITGGVNLVIDVVSPDRQQSLFGQQTVDVSADRVVIWTPLDNNQQVQSQFVQSVQKPVQMYFEGNLELRQGGHVIRATRAFYDARENRGLLLDADLLAEIPGGRVPLRVRAESIRKDGEHSFHAHNAWATPSPFGVPGYRLQARDVFLERRTLPGWISRQGNDQSISWLTTQHNTLMLGNWPVLFAPNLAGPASGLNIPLKRVSFQHDNVFGFQADTSWSLFSLLGIEPIEGVDWTLNADYFTRRGPRVGSGLTYQRDGLLGIPGDIVGWSDAAYLHDRGTDNLGQDRRALGLGSPHRGRGRWIHRHEIPGGFSIRTELGYVSDRNLLEQYYEEEFDQEKDQETLLYLEQRGDATAWSLLARTQVNDFETTTEWLPRGDLYVFSQPLGLGLVGLPDLSWSSHTSAGYARLRPADAPTDPADLFSPLPYTTRAGGAVLMSRHELSLPLLLGPAPVVPYVMAESGYWSEGMAGTDIDRHLFSGGLRASLSLSRTDASIRSPVLGLNGLAHKMTLETDLAWTETTRGLAEIPQYNEIDDNSQERFRYRFLGNTFGGTLPVGFDPRNLAVRQGAGLAVTAPWHELVADQKAMRLAWRHRLQTKVGPPGHERIRNWMTLDLEGTWFPDADRDNYGEDFGLLAAVYRWHVSDRTTLLADLYKDLFANAPELWNVGIISQRTARGTLFANLQQVSGGGIDSQIVTAGLSYRMSPKWVSTLATAYDLAEERNQGQSLTLTRIGGDFLVHVGASYDHSRGTAGFQLSLEPRFGAMNAANPQLGRLLGLRN